MPAEQKSELAFLPLQAARCERPGVPALTVGQGESQAGTFWFPSDRPHINIITTSFGAKNITLQTRGPNRPFKCLDNREGLMIGRTNYCSFDLQGEFNLVSSSETVR